MFENIHATAHDHYVVHHKVPLPEAPNALLLHATVYGDLKALETALERGANVNYQTPIINTGYPSGGDSPLISASYRGYQEIVQHLVSLNADVNLEDALGRTALMRAALRGHKDIVQILIDHKANLNVKNKYGHTAFMIAYFRDHNSIVKLLRKADADTTLPYDLSIKYMLQLLD